jgi:phosphatidylinositol alpha-1,6-mannosyltransferase
MRIVVASWNFPPRLGGAESYALGLAESLTRRHDVHVLAGRPAEAGSSSNLRLTVAPRAGFPAFCAWLPVALRRVAGAEAPDVLVAVNAATGALCRLPWSPRLPLATAVLGSDVAYRNPAYRAFVRRGLRRTDLVVAISRRTGQLAVVAGAHEERVTVIPPGVDPRLVDGRQAPLAKRPPCPVLLFVGRLIRRKGLLPFVTRSLPRILEQRPVELWVVGDEPTDSLAHRPGEGAALRSHLAAAGLEDVVKLFGRVPDGVLRDAYGSASLLVVPGLEVEGDVEGFGLVVPEAGLFGLPAVGTRTGGIPDAIVDGETGLLTEPGDWDGLAALVLRLLDDEPMRARLGENARHRARTALSWDTVADQWSAALQRLAP